MNAPRLDQVTCISPTGLHRMAYAEWGDPTNPRVVVCVHGLTRNGRDFDLLAERLAPDWRVICPDIVGRGRSSWLPQESGYAVPQYVADCVTLLARLNVPEVAWVGTSMGGLIGMALAAQDGTPIRRMVLNDIGPVLGRAGLERIGTYVGGPPQGFDTYEAGRDYIAQVSASFGRLDAHQWDLLARHTVVPDGQGRWKMHYDPRIGAATRAAVATASGFPDMWPLWDRIQAPVLALRGGDSDLLDDATATAMTQRGPRARRIDYPGIGHAPSLLETKQIDDICGFLNAAD